MTEPSPPFQVIDGGKRRDPVDDLPFGVPTDVFEVPGVRRLSGASVLHEIDLSRFAHLPDEELHWMQALVRFELHRVHGAMPPGEAARTLRAAMRRQGSLTRQRKMILDAMPEHSCQFHCPTPEFLTVTDWMERWWGALRFP